LPSIYIAPAPSRTLINGGSTKRANSKSAATQASQASQASIVTTAAPLV
jgi:hypothetical protein